MNSTLDPNVMWEKWKTKFLTVADFHAPPITKRVRSQYAPWITNNIRQVMRQRDYLKKKAVKTGSKQFHDVYRRTRNDINRLTRNTCMQQPLAYILQTLFQHEVFVNTPTLNAGSRCHVSHGNTISASILEEISFLKEI